MNDVGWVIHPGIWAHAADRAGRELPRWTKAWWRKTAELYENLGGKFFEESDGEHGSTIH